MIEIPIIPSNGTATNGAASSSKADLLNGLFASIFESASLLQQQPSGQENPIGFSLTGQVAAGGRPPTASSTFELQVVEATMAEVSLDGTVGVADDPIDTVMPNWWPQQTVLDQQIELAVAVRGDEVTPRMAVPAKTERDVLPETPTEPEFVAVQVMETRPDALGLPRQQNAQIEPAMTAQTDGSPVDPMPIAAAKADGQTSERPQMTAKDGGEPAERPASLMEGRSASPIESRAASAKPEVPQKTPQLTNPEFMPSQDLRTEMLEALSEPVDSIVQATRDVKPIGHAVQETRAAPTMPASAPAHQIAMQVTRVVQGDMDRLRVELHPEELGAVEISVESRRENGTQVVIAVERPETLDLLKREWRQLEQILLANGLDASSDGLQLELRDQGQAFHEHGFEQAQKDADETGIEGAAAGAAIASVSVSDRLFDLSI